MYKITGEARSARFKCQTCKKILERSDIDPRALLWKDEPDTYRTYIEEVLTAQKSGTHGEIAKSFLEAERIVRQEKERVKL